MCFAYTLYTLYTLESGASSVFFFADSRFSVALKLSLGGDSSRDALGTIVVYKPHATGNNRPTRFKPRQPITLSKGPDTAAHVPAITKLAVSTTPWRLRASEAGRLALGASKLDPATYIRCHPRPSARSAETYDASAAVSDAATTKQSVIIDAPISATARFPKRLTMSPLTSPGRNCFVG